MNKKTIWVINGVLLAILVVLTALYAKYSNPYVLKSLTSGWFMIIAVFNFIIAHKQNNQPKIYKILMLVGLAFACAGDIFLIADKTFVVGALLFAIGHIFYFCAFCFIKKLNWKDLILSVVLFGACCLVIFLYKGFNFNGMLPLIVVYALIISIMLAKAISNSIGNPNKLQTILIALGAILFFISDVCLLFYVFAGAPIWVDNLCLFTYYIGQGILATSLLYLNKKPV